MGKQQLKGAQAVKVRHILTEKQGPSLKALERLAAGEAFDKVAADVSEDKARQGGSLGWKTRGSMVPEFEAAAFALAPSSTSKPVVVSVKSSFGYHIIMVEDRK